MRIDSRLHKNTANILKYVKDFSRHSFLTNSVLRKIKVASIYDHYDIIPKKFVKQQRNFIHIISNHDFTPVRPIFDWTVTVNCAFYTFLVYFIS